MKLLTQILLSILLIGVSTSTLAGEELKEQQITDILTTLTSKPRDAWIPNGSITATHYQFTDDTGQLIVSTENVKYDGVKFRWDIDFIEHQELSNNNKEKIDIKINLNRTFVWDGTTYTMYFRSGKKAMVNDSSVDMPVEVNGLLRAGVIPWGNGFYTLENLLQSVSSAELDQLGHLHLSLDNGSGYIISLEMDPAKDYAVIFRTIRIEGKVRITTKYQNYMKKTDLWIPSSIIKERYAGADEFAELLSYDRWEIKSVDLKPCTQDQFKTVYDDNTHVEYRTSGNSTFSYRHKAGRDTDSMLKQKLDLLSKNKKQNHNCATAAIEHVASKFDRDLSENGTADLVTGPKKETTLYKLRQFAQQQNLYCQAVSGSIDSLARLENCQVILHLSKENHYVVLDYVDDRDVWFIDLDSEKFYYGMKRSRLPAEWSEQTALIISNTPIDTPAGCTLLSDSLLHEIKGSATYSCTDLIQAYDIAFCHQMMGCGGLYTIWYNRFGCELDCNGGNCQGDKVTGSVYTPCIEDFEEPGTCAVTGNFYVYEYLHACQ